MEILAPAGGEESLIAAVRCGADAVYLGAGSLNARRAAKNFDERGLAWALAFCRARGVKAYLTVNTLILEREYDLLLDTLATACALGIDAVIVQDLAVAATLRKACPELPLFASTQMVVTGPEGARMLERLGFSRVVLARELCLEEITAIRAATALELEVFVHGALCVGVSGQCYMSALIGGRSGNRGLCAQPCRLPFSPIGDRIPHRTRAEKPALLPSGMERDMGAGSACLSLKDLCLIDRLPQLAAAGVTSLKIEGRMKRPEYVAGAVSACRKALAGQHWNKDELAAIFSRSGFTQGYFEGNPGREMLGIRRKEDVTAAPAVLGKYRALYEKEQPLVKVDFSLELHPGKPATLSATDRDGNTASAAGEPPGLALSAPTTPEKARAALSKTGGTIFYAGEMDFDIAPGVILPAAGINALRREALSRLSEIRERVRPLPFDKIEAAHLMSTKARAHPSAAPALRLRLENATQLKGVDPVGAGLISLPLPQLEKLSAATTTRYRNLLAAELPRYEFGGIAGLHERLLALKEKGVAKTVAGSLGDIRLATHAGLEVHGDYSLNITNTIALEEYRALGLASATLSFELTLSQIAALGGSLPIGLIVYGYLPLMQLRLCPAHCAGGCKGERCPSPYLVDRKNKRFHLSRAPSGVSVLHNCLPLWMGDKAARLKAAAPDFLTLYFTRETPEEVTDIIRLFKEGGAPTRAYTRGLYYRGVE